MKFGSLQELIDLAHAVEERNMVVEKNREDFLTKHLKTSVATKWTMAKPNGGWTRILGGSDSTQTTSLNPTVTRGTDIKSTSNEKQSSTNSVSLSNSKTSDN